MRRLSRPSPRFRRLLVSEPIQKKLGRILMSMGPGGLLGGGEYFNPQGAYGPWAGCGCSSCLIILAGILLVMGGCLRMLGQ